MKSRTHSSQNRRARRFTPLTLLQNLLHYPLLTVQTLLSILISPLLFLLFRLGTSWTQGQITRHLIWLYGRIWMIVTFPFLRFSREGMDKEKFKRPCIAVVNHLSFFDIFCMGGLPISNMVFTVRSWPFKMPWYGPFMRMAEYVNLEGLGKEESLQVCKEILENGNGLIFYPEGHRSPDGNLQRFYSGAFTVAKSTGTDILPICITGTDSLLPPSTWWMQPAKIRIRALERVSPEDFPGEKGHIAMRKYVKEQMAGQIEEMRG